MINLNLIRFSHIEKLRKFSSISKLDLQYLVKNFLKKSFKFIGNFIDGTSGNNFTGTAKENES